MLDPSLFAKPIFTITVVVALFVTMGMFGTLMFLPLYVQGVVGMSAQGSGEVLTPMMLSFIVGSVGSGWLMSRTGRYKLMASIARFGAQGQTLHDQFVHAVRVDLSHGMGEIFTVGQVVAILAFLATFLLPEVGLKHDEFFDEDEEGAACTSRSSQAAAGEAGSAEAHYGNSVGRAPARVWLGTAEAKS